MLYPPEIEPLTGSLAESGYVNPKSGMPSRITAHYVALTLINSIILEIREHEIIK